MRTFLLSALASALMLISGCSTLLDMALGNCAPGVYSSVADYSEEYEAENRSAGTSEGAAFWSRERKFYCDQAIANEE